MQLGRGFRAEEDLVGRILGGRAVAEESKAGPEDPDPVGLVEKRKALDPSQTARLDRSLLFVPM
jgi:hypothetical protein